MMVLTRILIPGVAMPMFVPYSRDWIAAQMEGRLPKLTEIIPYYQLDENRYVAGPSIEVNMPMISAIGETVAVEEIEGSDNLRRVPDGA